MVEAERIEADRIENLAKPTPETQEPSRLEIYARAMCRVFVEETARIMRIKVSETWIQTRVDSRWPEYALQARAVIQVADQERHRA